MSVQRGGQGASKSAWLHRGQGGMVGRAARASLTDVQTDFGKLK